MPAFGNSSAFNEAVGAQRELGAYSFQQYIEALTRMQDQGRISDELRSELIWYARNQIEQGFASPEDISAVAQRVMPGLEQALQRRQGRLDSIADLNAARTPASQTLATILSNNQGQAEDVSRTAEANQNDINDLAVRAFGREQNATNEIQNRIGTDFGRFADVTGRAYEEARGTNTATTGDLVRRFGNAYSDLRSDNRRTFNDLGAASSGATRDLLGSGERTFRDLAATRDSTYGVTRDDLNNTIGGLESGNRQTFGSLLNTLGSGYDDLDSETGNTFSAAMGEVDQLGPASDVLVSRVARNFAPAIADTKANLRRAGISPNDPQYAAVMSEIGAERSRAMDEAKANAQYENVDRKNELRLQQLNQRERNVTGRQAGNERLMTALQTAMNNLGLTRFGEARDLNMAQLSDTERQALNRELMRQNLTLGDVERQIGLGTQRQANEMRLGENQVANEATAVSRGLDREIGLTTEGANRYVDLGREGSAATREETRRHLGAEQGIDTGRTNASLQNNDTAFERTQQWRQNGNNAAMLQRAMEQEDYETAANLLREQNGEEITAQQLRNMAYERGQDWVINNLTRRDAGQANLGNVFAREGQRQNDTARTAIEFGRQAQSAYGATQQNEAGQGNWATRLITGAASAGLNYLVPGLGTQVGGMANDILTPQTASRGGGGASGGGTGSGSTYDFNWVMPQYRAQQAANQSQQIARQQQAPALPPEAQPIRTQPQQQPPPYVMPNPNQRQPPQFQGWW